MFNYEIRIVKQRQGNKMLYPFVPAKLPALRYPAWTFLPLRSPFQSVFKIARNQMLK